MSPHEIPSDALLYVGEDVKPGLEKGIEAVCDLDGFVKLVVGRIHSVLNGLRAANREIAVELDHRTVWRHGLGRVDLHFVIALGGSAKREQTQFQPRKHPAHSVSFAYLWRTHSCAPCAHSCAHVF